MSERRKWTRRTRDQPPADPAVSLRSVAVGAICAWAFIATIGVGALALQASADRTAVNRSSTALAHADTALAALQHAQAAQQIQLQEGCERLNVQRALVNTANAAVFTLFRVVLGETRAAFATRRVGRHQRVEARRFLRVLRGAVDALAWTPLTNCVAAVNISGSAYTAPAPVAFALHPAPAVARSGTNARLPAPRGSVP